MSLLASRNTGRCPVLCSLRACSPQSQCGFSFRNTTSTRRGLPSRGALRGKACGPAPPFQGGQLFDSRRFRGGQLFFFSAAFSRGQLFDSPPFLRVSLRLCVRFFRRERGAGTGSGVRQNFSEKIFEKPLDSKAPPPLQNSDSEIVTDGATAPEARIFTRNFP